MYLRSEKVLNGWKGKVAAVYDSKQVRNILQDGSRTAARHIHKHTHIWIITYVIVQVIKLVSNTKNVFWGQQLSVVVKRSLVILSTCWLTVLKQAGDLKKDGLHDRLAGTSLEQADGYLEARRIAWSIGKCVRKKTSGEVRRGQGEEHWVSKNVLPKRQAAQDREQLLTQTGDSRVTD